MHAVQARVHNPGCDVRASRNNLKRRQGAQSSAFQKIKEKLCCIVDLCVMARQTVASISPKVWKWFICAKSSKRHYRAKLLANKPCLRSVFVWLYW